MVLVYGKGDYLHHVSQEAKRSEEEGPGSPFQGYTRNLKPPTRSLKTSTLPL